MSITNIIRKKRDGGELADEELLRIVEGAASGTVPDYQLSALLMAVCLAGMTPHETARLTAAMASSGSRLDLSRIALPKVGKHSTGGVGDTTSLILGPIVASQGIAVPMICGRGLGHTGGTADKLDSIPGFHSRMALPDIERQIADIGIAMVAPSDALSPAGGKLDALRDVTATIESPPLIAASILSKKLAENLDALVIDVKTGRGAFTATIGEARALAASIRDVSAAGGLPCSTFITRMDAPLGRRIGNWLEVCEAVRVLRGEDEPPLLMEVTLALAGACIQAAGRAGTLAEGIELARRSIADGGAYSKFLELVRRQGGDVTAVEHAREPGPTEVIISDRSGYVAGIDALRLGLVAIELGAGRHTIHDEIAPQAGIVLLRHIGEHVDRGEALCTVIECRSGVKVNPEEIRSCFTIEEAAAEPVGMVVEIVSPVSGVGSAESLRVGNAESPISDLKNNGARTEDRSPRS